MTDSSTSFDVTNRSWNILEKSFLSILTILKLSMDVEVEVADDDALISCRDSSFIIRNFNAAAMDRIDPSETSSITRCTTP